MHSRFRKAAVPRCVRGTRPTRLIALSSASRPRARRADPPHSRAASSRSSPRYSVLLPGGRRRASGLRRSRRRNGPLDAPAATPALGPRDPAARRPPLGAGTRGGRAPRVRPLPGASARKAIAVAELARRADDRATMTMTMTIETARRLTRCRLRAGVAAFGHGLDRSVRGLAAQKDCARRLVKQSQKRLRAAMEPGTMARCLRAQHRYGVIAQRAQPQNALHAAAATVAGRTRLRPTRPRPPIHRRAAGAVGAAAAVAYGRAGRQPARP